jgi:hypothetical protein
MKITLVSLTALAAFLVAPIATQASDKEVQNARGPQASYRSSHRQVALFVSGRGVGDQPAAPRIEAVSHAQVGQGIGVTFFTGSR